MNYTKKTLRNFKDVAAETVRDGWKPEKVAAMAWYFGIIDKFYGLDFEEFRVFMLEQLPEKYDGKDVFSDELFSKLSKHAFGFDGLRKYAEETFQ